MVAGDLGSLLVQDKVISQPQLKRALEFQGEVGGRLPVVLVKLGVVDEKKLVQFFAKSAHLKVVDLDELILPVNLIRRIPKDIMERHQIIPVAWNAEGETLTVVTFDPYDIAALEELQIAVECKVVINLATRSQIVRTINEFFYREEGERAKQIKDFDESAKKKGGGKDAKKDKGTLDAWKEALVPLLLDKKLISENELNNKAKEMGLIKP